MITLLYSGNFGLGHDLDTILQGLHALNGDGGGLKVLLVGHGKGMVGTRKLVEDLRLCDVEFRPPVSLDELPALLASGDIHIVAQKPHTEGLIVPSKIYGTLSAGRPVVFIGPPHCEVAQIVRESGCGFVVAPADIAAAADALRQLVGDAELRKTMGERARRYYAEHLGRKRSVGKIVSLIEQVGRNGHTVCPADANAAS